MIRADPRAKHSEYYFCNITLESVFMIFKCEQTDFEEISEIINDGAVAYKEVIPPDRWREPYMSEEELKQQIEQGVQFWCYK